MQKIYSKIYHIFICLISIACFTESGATCNSYSPPTGSGVDIAYLQNSTLYGYVLSNVLNLSASSCPASDSQINLYIRGNTTAPYTFAQGSSVPISNLVGVSFSNNLLSNTYLTTRLLTKTNQICLMMDTIYGDVPLICQSTATTFTNTNSTSNITSNITCFQSNVCTFSLNNLRSKVLFSITGGLVECVRDSLQNLFFNPGVCANVQTLNTFYQATNYLRKTIGALLTIYILMYGIRIILDSYTFGEGGGYNFKWNDTFMRIIKIVLVVYFTTGFNTYSVFNTSLTKTVHNGMVDLVLPVLQTAATDMANIVFNSTRTNVAGGLCQFDPSNYPSGYTYYALFDALDCRIGYYMGYGMIYNSLPANEKFSPHGFAIFKVVSSLLLTNPLLVLFNFYFVYVLLHVLLVTFVGSFVVNSVMICVMVFLSPLFVPLVLFEKTKDKFMAWMKLTLSFALQPMVMASFIAVMFSVYDQALYGDCIFTPQSYNLGSSGKTVMAFDISDSGTGGCTNTYGWKMYQYYSGKNWRKKGAFFFSFDILISDFAYVQSMLKVVVISALIYQLALGAQRFAANLTGGIFIALGGGSSGGGGGGSGGGGGGGSGGGGGGSGGDDTADTRDSGSKDTAGSKDGGASSDVATPRVGPQ